MIAIYYSYLLLNTNLELEYGVIATGLVEIYFQLLFTFLPHILCLVMELIDQPALNLFTYNKLQ